MENVNPRFEQFEHVFIAFAMLAALDVGVRQFIDQRDARFARQNRVHVHFFEKRALVLNLFTRHDFQLRDQLTHGFPAVGFNHSDHHIFAAVVPPDRFREHGVRLAHTRSIAKKQLEPAALLRRRTFFQPLFRSLGHSEYCR